MGASNEYINFDPNEDYEFEPPEDPDIPAIRIACCDCNLVHDIYLRIKGKQIVFSLAQNEEETDKLRQNKK